MAPSRDYYADLELPHTADVQEIKKQFRKLALKYHPDRNPGREQEVNSKFQIIQAAHEVLSDPQQKAKFDATLGRSSRYPTASGVRGNPWQNVSQQFPTPPRRNAQPRNPTSGAQRWNERFSSGVPPTAKQQASSDPSAKANAARAFESMRKGGAKGETRPPPPPPPPPRTEAAKKRAEASFGARKTGYHPRSAAPGDEPPVTNSNYSSRLNTERQHTMPDPLAQFRQKEDDAFMDSRQSTPYTTHGGEKTNPFDGIPIGRAKSTREPPPRDHTPESDEQRRSSSVPRRGAKDETRSNRDAPTDDERPRAAPASPSSRPKATPKSRVSAKASFGNPLNTGQSANRSAAEPSVNQTASKSPVNGTSSPSMYDAPQPNKPSQSHSSESSANPVNMSKSVPSSTQASVAAGTRNHDRSPQIPSGIYHTYLNLSPFELQQQLLLNQLIKNQKAGLKPNKEQRHATASRQHPMTKKENADMSFTNSFSFPVDDETFTPSPPKPTGFERTSVDDINTTFVNDGNSTAWQFSAGSGEADSCPSSRSQSGSRTSRRSPTKRPPLRRVDVPDPATQTAQPAGGFDADGWSNKFGPQTFVPQPTSNVSASPTRLNRANSRKPRTAKPTAGNAAVVDDSSSDEDTYEWRGRKAHQKAATVDSPQAMDIDPPQAGPEEQPAQAQPESTGARNIPVEPSRPEWRSGNVDGVSSEPEKAQENDIPANARGSEDSEEFRATLADLKNVAPFAEQKSGLKSFTDLKDNLPFESQASTEIPINLPQARPLVFPTPPVAPRLPPTVAVEGIKPNVASWSKYLEDFEDYLRHWDNFNSQVVDHFATRQSHISHSRTSKGYTFLGARGDGDIMEYHRWVQQDNDVRRRWRVACEEHEEHFREFMAFRERMK